MKKKNNWLLVKGFGMSNRTTPQEALFQLKEIMLELGKSNSILLAASITDYINHQMAHMGVSDRPSEVKPEIWRTCCHVLEGVEPNLNSLNLGWLAYRSTYLTETQGLRPPIESPQLVCSLPSHLREGMSEVLKETNIFEGSILESIADLISGAERLIQIVNPYWSEYGVGPIIRRLNFQAAEGLRAVILTRKDLSDTDLVGLHTLAHHFETCGIDVSIKYLECQNELASNGILHAKAVVVDRSKAYLGSANLTGNGMDSSVELGIVFEGLLVDKVSHWIDALVRTIDISQCPSSSVLGSHTTQDVVRFSGHIFFASKAKNSD